MPQPALMGIQDDFDIEEERTNKSAELNAIKQYRDNAAQAILKLLGGLSMALNFSNQQYFRRLAVVYLGPSAKETQS